MKSIRRFVAHQVKDRVPQRMRENEICPVCAEEHTLEEVYEKWSSGLDNRLCARHKATLDVMAFDREIKDGKGVLSE